MAQVRAKRPAAESVGEEEDFRSQLNSEIEVQGHTTKQRLIKTRCSDRPKAVFFKEQLDQIFFAAFFSIAPDKKMSAEVGLVRQKRVFFCSTYVCAKYRFCHTKKGGGDLLSLVS